MNALSLALLASLTLACRKGQALSEPDPGLERMMTQRRYEPFGASGLFRDGRAMRPPPAGAVPWSADPVRPLVERGADANGPATRIPVPVTRALLAEGRARFEAVCATCHGELGDGDSPLASKMRLRRPPSLHEGRVRALAPGRVFQVVTAGYGYMPPLASVLAPEERWAVVAYLRALQLSQRAELAALPADLRARVTARLP